MDRRTLIVSGLMTLGAASVANAQPLPPAQPRDSAPQAPPPPNSTPSYPTGGVGSGPPPNASGQSSAKQTTYSEDEIVHGVSDFLGVTAESTAAACST